jgi:hypothetical protein
MEHIEFENEKVRVLRVRFQQREKHPLRDRCDRILIWLTDAHENRTEPSLGEQEEIHRRAGEIAWRPASHHQIENLENKSVELIIVELKDR